MAIIDLTDGTEMKPMMDRLEKNLFSLQLKKKNLIFLEIIHRHQKKNYTSRCHVDSLAAKNFIIDSMKV